MRERAEHTIKSLLTELKANFPCFQKDQIFETLKSIYPDASVNKNNKTIFLNSRRFTKPLAVNRKDKAVMIKENNDMLFLFKDITKGYFLKVVCLDEENAKCINLSLKENIRDKYYNDKETKYIKITFEDVANGNLRLVKRKIDKYLK